MDRIAPRYTDSEKSNCARREVAFRKRVYDKKVREGRMSSAEAEREIGMMEEIASEYAAKLVTLFNRGER